MGHTQVNRQATRDSIYYYQRQMLEINRVWRDSMLNDPTYKNAMERVRLLRKTSHDYRSWVFFFDVADADYSDFNTSIVASGFPPVEGPVFRLGFGLSFKTKNTIVDFYSLSASLNKKSKKGNESIETNFTSAAQLDIGIDIAKSPKFNFYPFAGLSIRSSEITYEKPPLTNPSFTNISNLITNDQSATAYSSRLGVQAGIGFDYVLTSAREKDQMADAGFIFFLKAGINKPVGKERYNIEGYRYEPGIEYGKWIVTTGIKIFGKR